RSRNNLGRPIEVLNSLSLVGGARVNVIAALLRYDQAQFRLFVALGSPPPLLEPPQENLPPPPLTTPLRAPLPVAGHPFKLGAIAPVPRISTKSGPFSPGEWLESLPGSARGY